jgi:lipoprotein signal peptidase
MYLEGLHYPVIGYLVVLGYVLGNLLDRFKLGYLARLPVMLLLNK